MRFSCNLAMFVFWKQQANQFQAPPAPVPPPQKQPLPPAAPEAAAAATKNADEPPVKHERRPSWRLQVDHTGSKVCHVLSCDGGRALQSH
jgi:hypothetical protein